MHLPWIIAGLLILAAAAIRSLLVRRRHIAALAEFARGRRMTFSPDDLIGVQQRYANLELLQRGHSRHVLDLLYGATDAGLATAFRFTCELGFGSQRLVEDWWLAVLETPQLQETWRAVPASHPLASEYPTPVGPLRVQFTHPRAGESLARSALATVLGQAPPDTHIEVRGNLIAVATLGDSSESAAARVLDDALRLARCLKQIQS